MDTYVPDKAATIHLYLLGLTKHKERICSKILDFRNREPEEFHPCQIVKKMSIASRYDFRN